MAAADGRLGIALALGAAGFWALSAVSLRPGLDQVDVLTASAIRTSGRVYSATDQEAAGRFRAGGMSLPL